MSFKRFILDAADRQWPAMTEQQRSEHRALRAQLDAAPVPRFFLALAVVLFLAIPFVYWWASV